ncbi:MAG: hypothetical protein K2I39_02180, partial [Muribaculaceae bacterium]|nr:hypothetical protein [Muribaculaceae bacterium]
HTIAADADKTDDSPAILRCIDLDSRKIQRYESRPDFRYRVLGQKMVGSAHGALPYRGQNRIVIFAAFSNIHDFR